MKWYLLVLSKYVDFSGRARRKEYWMFALFNLLFGIVAAIIDNFAGTAVCEYGYGLVYFVYTFAVLLPGLAVAVRRMHDVGKSGWMILIVLIPLVGTVWLLVLAVTEGERGENKYGPDPKGEYTELDAVNISINGVSEKEVKADFLLLFVVVWMLFSQLFWTVVPMISDYFYGAVWYKYTNILFSLFFAAVPFAIAFAVKSKGKRTVVYVIGAVYAIFQIGKAITQFNMF